MIRYFFSNIWCPLFGHDVNSMAVRHFCSGEKIKIPKNKKIYAYSTGYDKKMYLNHCPRCGAWSINFRSGKITV